MARNGLITDWDEVPVLFDIGYACRIFAVTDCTIHNWINQKDMPVYNVGNQSPRFEKDEIRQWIKSQKRSVKKGA